MFLPGLNLWAVLISSIAVFILGGIWYSPKVFGAIWKNEAIKRGANYDNLKRHKTLSLIMFFILAFISAFAFAVFLGPYPILGWAIYAGLVTGICWVSASFAMNYLFSQRGWKTFLIDAGFHTLQFIIYGLVLGLWH